MSRWVHNPQGKIIAIVKEQSERQPLKKKSHKVGGGIILVSVLAIAIALVALWPTDKPAVLPISAQTSVEDRLLSGAAGRVGGDEYLFALTADGAELRRPALAVFTIDDSGAPQRVASLPAPIDELRDDLPAAPGIALSDGIAYIPLAGTAQSALWIVDVSTPESPRDLSTIDLETEPGSVAVDDGVVAVGPMMGTVTRLFDVSDPTKPQPGDTYRQPVVAASALDLTDSFLYIADDRAVTVVDVSSPENPQEIASWKSEAWTRGFPSSTLGVTPRTATTDGHLYAAADVWGVDILDIDHPEDISSATRKLSRSQIPGGGSSVDNALDVAVATDTLYILWQRDFLGRDPSCWEYTVQEIDVSDPGSPQVIAETAAIASESSLKSLAAGENHIYFLNGDRIHVLSTSEQAP